MRMTGDDFVGQSGTVYKEVAGKPPVINRPGHPVENILPVNPGFPPRKQRGPSQLDRRPFRAKSSVS
jgi:hypothetical protein